MLSLKLVDRTRPRAHELLVERLETPARRGRIILPTGPVEMNRAAEAVVRQVGSQCFGFEIDDKVVLRDSVTRMIKYGRGSEERILWICVPDQIWAKLKDFPDSAVKLGGVPTPQYTGKDLERWAEDDGKIDEGDPQAPQ
jgi:hypothetical protein